MEQNTRQKEFLIYHCNNDVMVLKVNIFQYLKEGVVELNSILNTILHSNQEFKDTSFYIPQINLKITLNDYYTLPLEYFDNYTLTFYTCGRNQFNNFKNQLLQGSNEKQNLQPLKPKRLSDWNPFGPAISLLDYIHEHNDQNSKRSLLDPYHYKQDLIEQNNQQLDKMCINQDQDSQNRVQSVKKDTEKKGDYNCIGKNEKMLNEQGQYLQQGDLSLEIQRSQINQPSKQDHHKMEREISQVIIIVKKWRQLHTKLQMSLIKAAQLMGISKKSLDDYYLTLRTGQILKYNFVDNLNKKMGHLRNYIKKARKKVKGKLTNHVECFKLVPDTKIDVKDMHFYSCSFSFKYIQIKQQVQIIFYQLFIIEYLIC